MTSTQLPHTKWICLLQWLGIVMLFVIIGVSMGVVFPPNDSVVRLKWLQLIQSVGCLLVPALFVAYLWTRRPMEWLRLSCKTAKAVPLGRVCVLSVVLMLVAMPGINLLNHLNQQLVLPACFAGIEAWMKQAEEAAEALLERFLAADTLWGLLINIGLMALVPALGEEMTFRGVLLNLFTNEQTEHRRSIPHAAIWATAILFSAVHMQFYGFVPRMLLGALFGYVVSWTGLLWVSILMHFVNNATAVVCYFIATRYHLNQDLFDSIGTADTLWLGIVSLCLAAGMFYWIYRLCQSEE